MRKRFATTDLFDPRNDGLEIESHMPGKQHRWTREDDATLTEMHADGCFVREIAAEIGVSEEQVTRRRKLLQLRANRHGRRPDIELRLSFIDGIKRHGSVKHAGRHVGIGQSAAANLARRMVRDGMLKMVPVGRVQHRFEPIEERELREESFANADTEDR